LQWIERSTREHDYLPGNEFSLADIAVIPYVIRLDMLRLSPMWRSYIGVPEWYERVRNRPAVERAIIGSMTQADEAPFAEIEFDPWAVISLLLNRANRTQSWDLCPLLVIDGNKSSFAGVFECRQ
jgi:hypothetical protein